MQYCFRFHLIKPIFSFFNQFHLLLESLSTLDTYFVINCDHPSVDGGRSHFNRTPPPPLPPKPFMRLLYFSPRTGSPQDNRTNKQVVGYGETGWRVCKMRRGAGGLEVTEIPVPRDHEVPVCSARHAIVSGLQL